MTPIAAKISETKTRTGTHVISNGPLSVKGSNPISKFAQVCIEAGHDPQQELIVMRGKTQCFKPLSLDWWAHMDDKKAG